MKRKRVWLDICLVVLLFVLGLGVRWLYARAIAFPPLDDPAFYLTTAGNLVAGRGLEVDVLWSYQTLFASVTHPSHEHWMPLPTGTMAAVFALLDNTLRTGQLPGLILGALLAPLTYLFGRRALPGGKNSTLTRLGATSWDRKTNRWLALSAALLIAVNATLGYQSASADSSATFALLAAWALAFAVRPPGDRSGYFGVGLLIGLAYLTRSDGLLLLVAVPLAWWLLPPLPRPRSELQEGSADPGTEDAWQHASGPRLANLFDLGGGFALIVAPWLVRNYLAFGTPLPSSVLSQAWLTDYIESFNYLSHPTWETYFQQGWQVLFSLRTEALAHNGGVFLLSTFPWGLLALPGLWLLRREWSTYPPLIYGLLLFFGIALVFPISSMAGTFYHSIGAIMPFLALAAVYAVYRGVFRLSRNRKMVGPIFAALLAGFLVLVGTQVVMSLPTISERHQAEKQQFESASAWLAQHAASGDVVMTTQPYTLNYASGHPAIVLPGSESTDAAWEAAQHYGARFLVITQQFGLYPQILEEQPDPRFLLVDSTEETRIYAIQRGQP